MIAPWRWCHDHRRRLLLGGALAVMALAQWLGATEALQFDRHAIGAGEWWRLVSAHGVHLGPSHMLLNGAVLVVVMVLVGRELTPGEWLALGLVCGLTISIGIWLWQPETTRFAGLSGVLHGLIIAGAMRALPRQRPLSGVILALLAIKLGSEMLFGPTPGTANLADGPVLVESHLLGALAGLAWGSAHLLWQARSGLRTPG